MRLLVAQLGRENYLDGLHLQHELLSLRQQDSIPDTLLLLEHPPVITIGKSGKADNVLLSEEMLQQEGVELHRIERGGDVTYHGPGQLVGYPILDLKNYNRSVKEYIHRMEEVFIQLLQQEYGIKAGREEGFIGVWVEQEKILAIGVAVKRRITMHGFALNVNPNLSHFGLINPCGITDRGVTSLAKLLGREISMEQIREQVEQYFCQIFEKKPEPVSRKFLTDLVGREHHVSEKA